MLEAWIIADMTQCQFLTSVQGFSSSLAFVPEHSSDNGNDSAARRKTLLGMTFHWGAGGLLFM